MEPGQNKRLHGLLNKTGLMDMKPELAFVASQGRTDHTSELTRWEADRLIRDLEARVPSWESDPLNKKRREVFRLCHKLNWTTPAGKVDRKALEGFLQSSRSKVGKLLNRQNAEELSITIYQLGEILKKDAK